MISRRGLVAGLGALCARPDFAFAEGAASAASRARPVQPPRDASLLKLTDAQGQTRPLSDWAGSVLVLPLWGPWCVPCQRELPTLSRLAAQLGPEGPTVLPLAFDWRGPNAVRKFYTRLGIDNLPVLMGDGENLKAVLDTELLPSVFVIGRDSRTLSLVAGEAVWDDAPTLSWLTSLL